MILGGGDNDREYSSYHLATPVYAGTTGKTGYVEGDPNVDDWAEKFPSSLWGRLPVGTYIGSIDESGRAIYGDIGLISVDEGEGNVSRWISNYFGPQWNGALQIGNPRWIMTADYVPADIRGKLLAVFSNQYDPRFGYYATAPQISYVLSFAPVSDAGLIGNFLNAGGGFLLIGGIAAAAIGAAAAAAEAAALAESVSYTVPGVFNPITEAATLLPLDPVSLSSGLSESVLTASSAVESVTAAIESGIYTEASAVASETVTNAVRAAETIIEHAADFSGEVVEAAEHVLQAQESASEVLETVERVTNAEIVEVPEVYETVPEVKPSAPSTPSTPSIPKIPSLPPGASSALTTLVKAATGSDSQQSARPSTGQRIDNTSPSVQSSVPWGILATIAAALLLKG